jgi:CRP/FNR family transcriptional regulator, cyclic AMP receptor protein
VAAEAALLAEVPFFALLDEEERATLASQMEVVRHPAGHVLFTVGDPGDSLYVIRSGVVEVFVKNDTGQRIVLETAGPKDFFGEMSLLDGGPRTASVIVSEDLEAIRVDRGDIKRLLEKHPTSAIDLLTAMGRRLRQTGELLRHTASRNVNREAEDTRGQVQRIADWIAEFSGSLTFLNLHLLFFFAWIVLNTEWVRGIGGAWLAPATGFDPFPYGLLTMSVSLEAIVLSVFVLLSQNRQVAKDRIRSDIEYDVNLKAELEVAHLHEKVDRLTAEVLARLEKIERRSR